MHVKLGYWGTAGSLWPVLSPRLGFLPNFAPWLGFLQNFAPWVGFLQNFAPWPGGFPAGLCSLCSLGGFPAELYSLAGFPAELCSLGGFPAELCSLSWGFPLRICEGISFEN